MGCRLRTRVLYCSPLFSVALPLHACTLATCSLGPAVCLHGELVMNGSPYRASFGCPGLHGQILRTCLVVAVRITIVPIVREALKLMRLCFSVLAYPTASFRYRAHLFHSALETSARRLSGMRAQHAIWPWTVATTVNRGRCSDIVGTRLRRAWRRGRTVLDTHLGFHRVGGYVFGSFHLAVLVFCYFLRFSQYAGLRNHGLGTPLGCPVSLVFASL